MWWLKFDGTRLQDEAGTTPSITVAIYRIVVIVTAKSNCQALHMFQQHGQCLRPELDRKIGASATRHLFFSKERRTCME